jgi:5'-3' exonuclease
MGIAFDDLEQVRPPEGNNLLVVDGLNLAFRWKHSYGEVDMESFLDTIESFAKSYAAGTIIILTDYKRSKYRSEIYPDYKANRTALYAKQTDEEAAAFKHFLETYEAALEWASMKHPVIKIKGVEADDLAACICDAYAKDFDHVWLISSDKDWDLLVDENVSRFSYVTRKEVTVDTWDVIYPGIVREQYIDFKVLDGDKGDNVPGIPLIGPVRAKKLLEEYGSAFDIIDSIPIPGTAKFIQNLNKGKDQLLLNFELMDLRTYCWEALGENRETFDNIMEKL